MKIANGLSIIDLSRSNDSKSVNKSTHDHVSIKNISISPCLRFKNNSGSITGKV